MAARAPWDMEISVRTLQLRADTMPQKGTGSAPGPRVVRLRTRGSGCSIRVFGTTLCERHLHVFFMVEIQGTVDNSRPVGVVHPSSAATTSYYWQQYGLERKR